MKKFALVGKDIQGSFSPIIHSFCFENLSLEACYHIIDIESSFYIPGVVDRLKSGDLDGINITAPYKKDFISCLPNGGMKKGTMESRLITAGDRIQVKTGGLSGVTNISGYIFSNKYGPIAFSILTSGYVGNSNPYRELQDNIILSILND